MGLGEKHQKKLKTRDKATFYSPTAGTLFEKANNRFRSISAQDEQERFKPKRRSKNPIVVTASGEVQTNEVAPVYVHDLHLFVTVQLHEDTPAVL